MFTRIALKSTNIPSSGSILVGSFVTGASATAYVRKDRFDSACAAARAQIDTVQISYNSSSTVINSEQPQVKIDACQASCSSSSSGQPLTTDEYVESCEVLRSTSSDQFISLLQTLHIEISDTVRQAAINISRDPELLLCLTRKISKQTPPMKQPPQVQDSVPSTAEEDKKWDELANDHKCAICQDVLATPHVLDCKGSHSFCGICVTDFNNSCQVVDDDDDCMPMGIDVVHNCPSCKEKFECAVYVRDLDNVIIEKVEQIGLCKKKEEWQERRDRFKKLREAAELGKKKKRGTHASESMDGSSAGLAGDDDFDDTLKLEVLIGALFVVGLLVSVIATIRRNSNSN